MSHKLYVNVTGKFTKTSAISHKRIQAANPILGSIMTKKFILNNAQLISEGCFGETGVIEARHVANTDEIGFDPEGKMLAHFSLTKKREERAFTAHTSEHAAFHVTVCLTAIADGTMLPPLIIHQGGTETMMPAHFALNLDPEMKFRITSSPSGYMTDAAWRVQMSTIFKESCTKNGESLISYIDGFDSHFDGAANEYCLAHNIKPRFLQANNSIGDQALDMGINCIVKASYDVEYALYRQRNPLEPIKPPIFNMIFTKAWRRMMAIETLSETIRNAFAKSHVFPLVDMLAPVEDASLPAVAGLPQSVCMAKLAQPLLVDLRDQATVAQFCNHGEQIPEVEIVPLPVVPGQVGEVAIKLKVAVPGTVQYQILVSAASHHYFQQSTLAPAQEQQDMRDADRAARKIKIVKGDKNCLNPDTTTGCCVTTEVLEQIRVAEALLKTRATEKVTKTSKRIAKRNEVIIMNRQLANELITVATTGGDLAAWRKLPVKNLSAAYKYLSPVTTQVPTLTRKIDLLRGLEPLIAALQCDLAANHHIPDTLQPEDHEEDSDSELSDAST